MTARQGRLLLRRQLSQLPRWLAQVRYNGPPPTHLGKLTRKPRNFAANPALSGDGARVVFEGYEQKLPVALKRGEISVLARAGRRRRAARNVSARRGSAHAALGLQPDGLRRRAPRRVRVRRGQPQLRQALRPDPRLRQRPADRPHAGDAACRACARASRCRATTRSSRRTAATSPTRRSAAAARARSTSPTCASGRPTLASRGAGSAPRADDGVYDPAISGDGPLRRVHDGGLEPRRRRPARPHAGLRPRPRGAHDDARQPRERRARRGRRRLLRRSGDLARRALRRVLVGGAQPRGRAQRGALARLRPRPAHAPHDGVVSGARGFAIEPSISADGRVVAYTSIARGRSRVLVRDARGRGAEQLASRATRRRRRGGRRRVVGRDDLRRRAPRRVHVGGDEPRRRQAGRPPRRVRARPARADDDARQRAGAEGRASPRPRRRSRPRARRGAARGASWRCAARRCRARRSSRSSTTRSSAAATGRRCACGPAAC